MKICFIVNNFPPRLGGVESHTYNLAQALRSRGHEVTVITLSEQASRVTEDGLTVLRYKEVYRVADVLGFPRFGFSRWLRRTLKEIAPDVISVHTRFFPLSYLGVRRARGLGIPVIFTEHGSGSVASDSAVISAASRLVDSTLGRYTIRKSDRVLGVSEAVTSFVKELAGRDAQVFHNGIDFDSGPVGGAPEGPRDLVFIGRIVAGKGWDVLLDAVALLQRDNPEAFGSVHILGGGAETDKMTARIGQLGLNTRVQAHGRVDPGTVRELVRHNVYVNPTTLSEGFQTTLLEAAAEHAQIVTYPVPGAEFLREQGAPVRIVAESNARAWANEILGALESPGAPLTDAQLSMWAWPNRAAEYESLMEDTRDRYTRKR